MSKKPFNLQIAYLKNPQPSELQSAFDLRADYVAIDVNSYVKATISSNNSRSGAGQS